MGLIDVCAYYVESIRLAVYCKYCVLLILFSFFIFETFLQSREIGNRSSSTSLMTDNGHIPPVCTYFFFSWPPPHRFALKQPPAFQRSQFGNMKQLIGKWKTKTHDLEFDEPRELILSHYIIKREREREERHTILAVLLSLLASFISMCGISVMGFELLPLDDYTTRTMGINKRIMAFSSI